MPVAVTPSFKFRKHASVGASDADQDQDFLRECYVDTGDLEPLLNCRNPLRIVIGRTGSGKTALLNKLAERPHVIVIRPETLSFSYITNSNILQFFSSAGVKFDLFFKLLWRHVFTVELIKSRYQITNELQKNNFLARFREMLPRDKKKERAVNYLLRWGEEFWQPTEYRIKEITNRIESDLSTSLGANLAPIQMSAAEARKLTEEQRTDVVTRGQNILNTIQLRELSDILDFLNEDVFSDPQLHFYLCIDRLDEDWVEERLRYPLIRSLIETVRDFRNVENVKVVVALRTDLLDRVLRFTRDSGFQEEKYRDLYLRLEWTEDQLNSVLDNRVNYLVRQSYTSALLSSADLLPGTIDGARSLKYLISRTMRRPRELIEFFNCCIEQAVSKPTITKEMVMRAEGIYSRNRLQSLQDEWSGDYPDLADFVEFLRDRPKRFKLGGLDRSEAEGFALDYAVKNPQRQDLLSSLAHAAAVGTLGIEAFLSALMYVLYQTGVIGLKTESFEVTHWAYERRGPISKDSIGPDTSIEIHPVFYRALGTKLK